MTFEAVRTKEGYEVKIKLGKKWYTIADCYSVPKIGDASENAELITKLLNNHMETQDGRRKIS